MSTLPDTSLAISAIAETAMHEFLSAQIRRGEVADIRTACKKDAYWTSFCLAAKSGLVPSSWLPGAIGSVVLGWALAESLNPEN